MRFTTGQIGLVALVCVVGCAGTQQSADTAPNAAPRSEPKAQVAAAKPVAEEAPVAEIAEAEPAPEPEAAPADEGRVAALPTECAGPGPCVTPAEFVAAACSERYPSMAIAMFEKHTPWRRLYLKTETAEAVNVYAKREVGQPLVYGEEVIVLRESGDAQVSSSDIDVLRWDGSCATLSKELFSNHQMSEVENAPIEWRSLDGYIRQALLKSKYVKLSYDAFKDHCKTVRSLEIVEPDEECERITIMLNDSVTVAVRGGIKLPVPDKLPRWAKPEAGSDQTVAMSGL